MPIYDINPMGGRRLPLGVIGHLQDTAFNHYRLGARRLGLAGEWRVLLPAHGEDVCGSGVAEL